MDKLPKGWNYKRLDIISKVVSGYAFPSIDFSKEGIYKTIKITNVGVKEFIDVVDDDRLPLKYDGKFSSFRINTNDIVIALTRSIINDGLKVAIVPNSYDNSLLNQRVAAIKSENNLNRFIYYFLTSSIAYNYIQEKSKSLNQPNLSINDLKSIQIPLPPLSEQIRIVTKLDALFARIDKSIILLEENIKHTKGLMASVLEELFHSSSKQIALSEIVVKTMNINPLVNPETQFTYIDITSVNNRLHKIEDPKVIQGKDAPSRAKKSVIAGDIVFATTRPNLKNIAIVKKDYSNPVASTGFCVLRTKKGISNEFLFLCLLSNNIQDQINPFIRGAQYPAISDKDLLKCKVPDLPIIQQMEIANKVMYLRKKLSYISEEQQSKLAYLKALKSSILDRAFKGEL